MGLFKTTTRRTYRRPQAKRGWSTTLTAKTRLKRWAKRRSKQLWRKAKQRIRRRWRKYLRQRPRAVRNRQIARTAQQFQRRHTEIHGRQAERPNVGMLPGQEEPPTPPDGAVGSCRRCHNEVVYSGGNERWEHPGRGDAECFKPHRS